MLESLLQVRLRLCERRLSARLARRPASARRSPDWPIAGAQPRPQERVLMRHSCRSQLANCYEHPGRYCRNGFRSSGWLHV